MVSVQRGALLCPSWAMDGLNPFVQREIHRQICKKPLYRSVYSSTSPSPKGRTSCIQGIDLFIAKPAYQFILQKKELLRANP